MTIRRAATVAGILYAGLVATGTHAAVDLALGAAVTSTPYYDSGSEVFPASNITDGRLNDTGSPSDWSFWLTPNGSGGTATIDLGASYDITSFYIQNTLNRGYQDRETDGLNVYVGSSPTTFGTVSSYGSLVQAIEFADTEGAGVIADDTFGITPTVGRYITVDITSFYGGSGGLNEVEAFGSAVSSAPEPATWALMFAGMAGVGSALRQSRRKQGVAIAA